jgi:menaquinone-dependent protoporphyrinogen oxidase
MKRILIAYGTFAGSTADVARAVGEEIARSGAQVDVLPLAEVKSLAGYDGAVVGAPMIMGWQRSAARFLRRNRAALEKIPLAVFVTALSLTATGETSVGGVPVCVDATLPRAPARAGRLTLRERYARLPHYLQPILRAARPAKPVSIGVFGGKLEYGRLPRWAVVFAMFVVQAPAGDKRNWPAIRAWAAGLAGDLRLQEGT